MNIELKSIELFDNLAQLEISGNYFDFHNDFDCLKLSFNNHSLIFFFKNSRDDSEVLLTFHNADLIKFDIENLKEAPLTIDTLYRGRYELEGQLLEFSDDGKSYIYFEFVEGLSGEFFSSEFMIKIGNLT